RRTPRRLLGSADAHFRARARRALSSGELNDAVRWPPQTPLAPTARREGVCSEFLSRGLTRPIGSDPFLHGRASWRPAPGNVPGAFFREYSACMHSTLQPTGMPLARPRSRTGLVACVVLVAAVTFLSLYISAAIFLSVALTSLINLIGLAAAIALWTLPRKWLRSTAMGVRG